MYMAHRLNIMLDDAVWESLQQLPKGARSRYISQAVEERLRRERRQSAAAEMDALRGKLRPLGDTIDVVEMLRKDRARDDA
jgi:predicted transcriptional regulator